DEKLFIDEVDHDYCYRAKLLGYSIKMAEGIALEHVLGREKEVHTFWGTTKKKTFHSPFRLYYIVRNGCYVVSTYKKKFRSEMKARKRDILVRIKNHLLYGPKKLSSLKHIVLGYIHYKKNRFGKL